MKKGSKKNPAEIVAEAALEQFKFTTSILIPKAVVDNMTVSAEFKELINSWAIKIDAYVWSEGIESESYDVTLHAPKTWWDHFKITHFPNWLQRKFPPVVVGQTRRINIKRAAIFPKLGLMLGEKDPMGKYAVRTSIEDEVIQ